MRSYFIPLICCLSYGCPETATEVDAGCAEDCLATGFCYEDDDCDSGSLCFNVRCRRDTGCTDSDESTACPDECIGVCGNLAAAPYCLAENECADGFSCRIDDRFCLHDRRTEEGACVGWCVPACFGGVTAAVDPETGTCFDFSDSCTPPGFSQATSSEGCVGY